MRVGVHTVDRRFLATHAAPPVRIADKEELLLCEEVQAWEMLIRGFSSSLLPRLERCGKTAGIGDVLSKSQTSIDVEGLSVGPFDGEVGVLLDKALGFVRKGTDCFVRPPISVIAILVVVSSGGIEGM